MCGGCGLCGCGVGCGGECGCGWRWRWGGACHCQRPTAHLVVDFIKGVLQLAVDRGQLLEVPVGFVDGQQDLIDLVDGLVHGSL